MDSTQCSAEIINLIDLSLGEYKEMGGPGSGHFHHTGRKGHRGGSAPSKGGKERIHIGLTGAYNAREHQDLVNEWSKTWGEKDNPFAYPPHGNYEDMIYSTVRQEGKLVAGLAAENEGRGRIHILHVVSHATGAGTKLGEEFLGAREKDYVYGGAASKEGAAWFERLGFVKDSKVKKRYWTWA